LIIDAMVTAGGIPKPGESLYEFSQGRSKALIDVAGKPMVQWVLDALSEAKSIGNVVVVGLDETSGLSCKKSLSYLPNQGGMLDNIRGGAREIARLNPKAEFALIVSSDIPTITGEMVDWVGAQVRPGEDEALYNVIERSVMEKRFPDSRRTFTKLKGIEVCGGDLNPVSVPLILSHTGPWERISDARKSALKMASLVGFDTLILLLLRAMTLDQAAARASRNLGLRARAVLCPHAELGMDVDKLHHLEIVRAALGARRR
jgi:GTP:adenosylcobinamide-phosphate guanylyltransferase